MTTHNKIHVLNLMFWFALICVGTSSYAQDTTNVQIESFSKSAKQSNSTEQAKTAKGIVFHDVNKNQIFDSGDKQLPGIKVSNGEQIVKTDKDGKYSLPVSDDTIIFVIKPSGWRTPVSKNQLPKFYYIHKPKGSPDSRFKGVQATGPLPESIDFPLYPQDEPKQFRAIMFGDPQPRNQKEIDFIAHDVVEELIGTDASFGVTLGDIMFDNLDLFQSLSDTIALIGIPWYNVIGNHDINLDAKTDAHSDETFERNFGPAYYSFDYGSVHFVVIDNVEWYVPEGKDKGTYRGGVGKKQMEFIESDLAQIPKDQLVVLMMHIPIVNVRDNAELYRLIEKRKFCMSISGHTHHQEHRFLKKKVGFLGAEPHHHVINVTVSGSWWGGNPDERGIPHATMADGAPNGYSIISFDGKKYSIDYKAAGRPVDYQMNIYAPEKVQPAELSETQVFVNLFNGSERSKVEMKIGENDWTTMEKTTQVDPTFAAVFKAEQRLKELPLVGLPKPKLCSHLWKTSLPVTLKKGTYMIQIRATDESKKQHLSRRVIRVQ